VPQVQTNCLLCESAGCATSRSARRSSGSARLLSVSNVFDSSYAHSRNVHLYQRFFHRTLPSPVAFDDGRWRNFGTFSVTSPAFVRKPPVGTRPRLTAASKRRARDCRVHHRPREIERTSVEITPEAPDVRHADVPGSIVSCFGCNGPAYSSHSRRSTPDSGRFQRKVVVVTAERFPAQFPPYMPWLPPQYCQTIWP
jgi:hypothetical protein